MNINYYCNTMYVEVNPRGCCQITSLLINKNGVTPYCEENNDFLSFYPHISAQLREGKILYIDSGCAYIGTIQSVGPYDENHEFVAEYTTENPNLAELLSNLDEQIEKQRTSPTTLIKIGPRFRSKRKDC